VEERRLNIRKWGDAYRQYMKEVPRWNIALGLVRLGRKRRLHI
jgi:protein-S-isoprenylcysteine O-methyltransferase Ste14